MSGACAAQGFGHGVLELDGLEQLGQLGVNVDHFDDFGKRGAIEAPAAGFGFACFGAQQGIAGSKANHFDERADFFAANEGHVAGRREAVEIVICTGPGFDALKCHLYGQRDLPVFFSREVLKLSHDPVDRGWIGLPFTFGLGCRSVFCSHIYIHEKTRHAGRVGLGG